MRRLLGLALLFSAVLSGALASLSVLPHAHGDDWTHAQHEACPIHQAALHGPQADGDGLLDPAPSFVFLRTLLPRMDRLPVPASREFAHPRAPPIGR